MTYGPGYRPDASGGYPFGPPGVFPGPPPPTRPRVHVIWLIVAISASLVAGSAGFAAGDAFSSHRAQISAAIGSARAGGGTGQCPPPPAAAQAGQRLLPRLLPRPAGARSSSSSVKIPPVLDLSAYIHALYSSSSVVAAQLTARCFQIAVHELWVTQSGSIVSIYLAQFATAADARSYELFTEAGDLGAPGVTGHLALPGVGDGMAVQHGALDKVGNTFTHLLGDRGNVVMIIHLFVPARLATRAQDLSLLRAQSVRL